MCSIPAAARTCSRAFIRAAAQDDELPVPSPTFLLQNIYSDHPGAEALRCSETCHWHPTGTPLHMERRFVVVAALC